LLFNSWTFWLFFPIVAGCYFLLRGRQQNLLLLVASYVFYGWWDWRFLGLLLLSTVVDYVVALRLDPVGPDDSALSVPEVPQPRRKRLLVVSIVVNLGVLGFFKYFGFFEESFVALLSTLLGYEVSPTGLDIILPVGISFYTFQSMSYTIDVYRRQLHASRSFVDFATFVAFFPQLVAGPIVRASELMPQLRSERVYDNDRLASGGYLMLWGMFKKVVVADNLAPLVNHVFASDPAALDGTTVLIASYAFAFQIYGDFSGYTDIARGSARLLGFDFPLNFDLPYVATSPSDFWRRWHISLSTWLRDYLYIPLGGNRSSPRRVYVNLMLTMLLGGLWHGAAWTFVLWGAYQGLLLVTWRFVAPRVPSTLSTLGSTPVGRFLRWLLFFHLVCLGWLIFRAQSFDQLYQMVLALGGPWHPAVVADLAYRIFFYSAPLIAVQIAQHWSKNLDVILNLPAPARGLIYALWLLGISLFGQFDGTEFIYFQF